MRSHRFEALTSLLLLFGSAAVCSAQTVNPALFSDMRWREIGPMRAGRTRALAGVPSQPATSSVIAPFGPLLLSAGYRTMRLR